MLMKFRGEFYEITLHIWGPSPWNLNLPNYDKLPTPPGINTLIILSLEGAGAKFGRGGIEIGGGGKKNILWIYISGDVLAPRIFIFNLSAGNILYPRWNFPGDWVKHCPVPIEYYYIFYNQYEDARRCTRMHEIFTTDFQKLQPYPFCLKITYYPDIFISNNIHIFTLNEFI
jgi:hypothetical protein